MRQKGLLHGYEKETIGNSHLRGGTCVAVAAISGHLSSFGGIISTIVLSAVAFGVLKIFFPDKVEQTDGADKSAPNAAKPEEKKQPEPKQDSTPKPEEKKQSEPSTGNPELDAILKQGAQSDFQNSGAQRRNSRFQALRADQADRNTDGENFRLRQRAPAGYGGRPAVLNYYLPTTIKLLEQYVVLQNQGMRMGNIDEGMKKIEDMLDKVIVAFQRQLDSLFESSVVDITADIQVMEQMMASEGLTGKDF